MSLRGNLCSFRTCPFAESFAKGCCEVLHDRRGASCAAQIFCRVGYSQSQCLLEFTEGDLPAKNRQSVPVLLFPGIKDDKLVATPRGARFGAPKNMTCR